ncbi:MAG TPA: aldehyde dehydrogenase family protein [Polyangiaceae bacterium]|jgi:acyl-CoA reductase-like NAD-dependent aldehyde dehydrogenase
MTDTASSDDVPEVVARARAAQPAWAALTADERARRIAPLKNRVLDRAEAIARVVREEVGKPEVEALLGEVLPSADVVQYWTSHIADLLDPEEIDIDAIAYPGKEGTLEREARGVVAVIMPWNFPFALPLRTIVPALLAGNAVVFKPSEVSPKSGALVAEVLAGLVPDGLFGLVQGAGPVGTALCEADVDLVVFTGSVATGRKVAHACAERLVPSALELGGKDAAIVLADADLDRAANGVVWGAMMNAGQNCASVERVYVVRSVGEAFTKKVCDVVASLKPGVDVGPLATPAQRAIVARHVDAAKAAGAKVLAGGAATSEKETREYPPTVVSVQDDETPLMSDETFGPVLPIALVDDADEAVRRANASRYGLTASLWTRDKKKAAVLARKLRAGVVTINNHGFTGALPNAPWSGHGETGWGITGSSLALDTLTRPRLVLVDRSRGKSELWWYPYTPALRNVAVAMATLRSGTRSIFARIGALFRLVGAMLARGRGQ